MPGHYLASRKTFTVCDSFMRRHGQRTTKESAKDPFLDTNVARVFDTKKL